MQKVIDQFDWIKTTLAFATDSIQNLGKRSAEIGKIVKVISQNETVNTLTKSVDELSTTASQLNEQIGSFITE